MQKGSNNLGYLLRPEPRPPRLNNVPSPSNRLDTRGGTARLQVSSPHNQRLQLSQQPQESRPSVLSDQMGDDDDAESGAMSSQLRANQTYSKP